MANAGKEWGEVDASSGFDDKKKLADLLPIVDKNDFKDTFKEYRFVGGVQPYQEIWLPIFKDGKPVISKSKKPVKVPFIVTNYNLETHKVDESLPACPYVEVADKMNKYLSEQDQLRVKQSYLACAIDREAQENPPRKIIPATKAEIKAGFYDIDSPSTKMTAVFDMTPTLFRKVKGLKDLNKIKDKKTGDIKTYHVTDPKRGCNVNIKFSPKEKGGAMYDAQKSERTPLTEEEQEYLLWDITSPIVADDYKTAKKEADRLWKEFAKSIKGKAKDEDDEDEDMPADLETDDEDEKPSKKKSKDKVKAKAKKKPDPDEDEDDEDDDEEDIKPKKSKKPIVDDDEDDDDEDEDDKPTKKVKGKASKKVVDDDEDDDDPDVDLDDDDDAEDEKPAKKKKASKKVVDDDEDDEEDDKPIKKSSKKNKKPDPDEDDEDMEDLPDDDDDEDEKPVKKSSKKKKKVVDDDEDDED